LAARGLPTGKDADMISRFSTVYAGHGDLGDMGQSATPANERRHANEHLASVFEKTEAIARCMDEHGFSILWLAEHHFQHEGYEVIPNVLMAAVHLAHLTSRLRIGCGFNITPMWHPLRLAEDFATADIVTRGRTVFGVGRGYHTRARARRSARPCSTPRPWCRGRSTSRWSAGSRSSAPAPAASTSCTGTASRA
jgi:hypothetical protein